MNNKEQFNHKQENRAYKESMLQKNTILNIENHYRSVLSSVSESKEMQEYLIKAIKTTRLDRERMEEFFSNLYKKDTSVIGHILKFFGLSEKKGSNYDDEKLNSFIMYDENKFNSLLSDVDEKIRDMVNKIEDLKNQENKTQNKLNAVQSQLIDKSNQLNEKTSDSAEEIAHIETIFSDIQGFLKANGPDYDISENKLLSMLLENNDITVCWDYENNKKFFNVYKVSKEKFAGIISPALIKFGTDPFINGTFNIMTINS
ncbi:MAG: hypothetical protein LBM93_00860 [Oscillospiraceae bacterium]|jgi:hypothetical protein|nr:hypothetical protein [Oscillospiraceae bacterium]